MATQRITKIFFAAASVTLLTCPSVVLGDDLAFTGDIGTKQEIAWATIARSVVENDDLDPGKSKPAHICRAKLYYMTNVFLEQAAYASELIRRTPLDPEAGGALVINFDTRIRLNASAFEWSGIADADGAFRADSPQFSDPEYCLVLVETPIAQNSINGMAWVCRMCEATLNVAFVSTLADDAIVFSVIMHELGHMLCADHDHSGGVMRPTAIGDSRIGTLSGTSVASISRAVARNSGDLGCLKKGTTEKFARRSHRGHYVHEHDVDDGAVFAASFFIFTLLFFALLIPCWLLY